MKQFVNGTFQFFLDKVKNANNFVVNAAAKFAVKLIANMGLSFGFKFVNTYRVECVGADGSVKWVEEITNLVPDAGANDLLDKYFAGSAYTAAWMCGLIDNASFSAIANADTMASHAGWVESTAYSNANRPTLAFSAASGRSKATSSAASFSINATATINGAFVTSNNTKGGTSGILYGAASFGATRSVVNTDTLNVSVTLSIT